MANTEIVAGVQSYVLYDEETTYGTAVSTTTQFGGLIQRFNVTRDRNLQERAGFVGTGTADGRKTAKTVSGTYGGSISMEFDVQRWDWLEYVLLGTRTGSGIAGAPYVYPLGTSKRSITITENMDNDTDSERSLAGVVINSARISCSVGGPVTASLDMLYGKETKDTSISSKVAQLTDDLYTFVGGTLEITDGTPIGNVIDSVELTISNNYELTYGLGAYTAANARPGKLNISLRFTTKYLDDDQIDDLFGDSGSVDSPTVNATAALKFTKGGSYYVDFVFTNFVIHRLDSDHNLNELVMENSEAVAYSLEVSEVLS